MPRPVEIAVRSLLDSAEVARGAAEFFTACAETSVATRGHARIAISGGTTPKAVLELLSDPAHPYRSRIPWERLHLFWVDERCVGPADAESNYGMTKAAMLDKVPLKPANIHRMEGEFEPEEAAARYESAIRNTFKLEGAEVPAFDLILLGLGPDGHTASLFPHTEALNEMARLVVANHVPQKDAWRLTLTWPVLNQGRELAFLIEGAGKAEMVERVFTGAYDPETYPAQLIRPSNGRLTLFLDAAAASKLPAGCKKLELQ